MDEATEILRFEELESQADQALGTIAQMMPASAAFYADEVLGTADPAAQVALIARKVEEGYVLRGEAIPAHVASATTTLRPRVLHGCKVAASADKVGGVTPSASQGVIGQLDNDAVYGLTAFQKRKLVKQLFLARCELLKAQFRASVEIDRGRLDAQVEVAKANVEIQRDTVALSIREDYLKILAGAGMRVDLSDEFLGVSEKTLEELRHRLAAGQQAATGDVCPSTEQSLRRRAYLRWIAVGFRWLSLISALPAMAGTSVLMRFLPILFMLCYAIAGVRSAKNCSEQEHVAERVYFTGYIATLATLASFLGRAVWFGFPSDPGLLILAAGSALSISMAGLIISEVLRWSAKDKPSPIEQLKGRASVLGELQREAKGSGVGKLEKIDARAAIKELDQQLSNLTATLLAIASAQSSIGKQAQGMREDIKELRKTLDDLINVLSQGKELQETQH